MGDIAGIEVDRITDWYQEHVAGSTPPLSFHQVAGGRSNLTFIVTDGAGRKSVLRRPPVSHLLPTAHDMNREQTIISALGPTDVPVPAVLGYCAEPEVTGQPFYVMDFVDGLVLRASSVAEQLTPDQRSTAARSLIDVLTRIHAVDPDEVGLGDLSRKDGYIARQLKRWHGQFEKSKSREVPLVDEMHDWLLARIPEEGPAGIVHGDYRLDNTIVGPDGTIQAVLDWELCTLGARLVDLAMILVYWTDAGDDPRPGQISAASTLEGFPKKQELVDLYADLTGADLTPLDYYVAFGYWKLACISDGVFTRYRSGAMGNDTSYSAVDPVPRLAQASKDAAERYRG